MVVKSFRGRLGNGEQVTIPLSTNDGRTGYKITKFQTMMMDWGSITVESVTKIFMEKQDVVTATIDFSKTEVLGASVFAYNSSGNLSGDASTIIFDNEVFNQDIFITQANVGGSVTDINYYLELEQFTLASDEATVATLKDIKLNA